MALLDDSSGKSLPPVAKEAGRAGAPTVVVGLGATGLSCVRHLAKQGRAVMVVDSRMNPPALEILRAEHPQTRVLLGAFPTDVLAGAREIVLSPGVSTSEPAIRAAIDANVPVCGDIELFARLAYAPVVAITGSNAKSTVTSLLAQMARLAGRRVQAGGNLGPPALSLLMAPDTELFVLELSSFQLETTSSLRASAATVLNISADHMDRYPGIDSYIAAKARVFCGNGAMVLNRDDAAVASMAQPGRTVIGFTLGEPLHGDMGLRVSHGKPWLAHGNTRLMPCDEIRLHGSHNVANVLAAMALGIAVGLDYEPMLAAARSFGGLPHRCEVVARRDGVTWINDSKGTNVGATVAAIGGTADRGRLVLIAGGDAKGADFTSLRTAVAGRVRALVLLGRDAPLIEAAVAGAVPVFCVADMEEAVARAAELAQRGDGVMLSPACASFDMYDNYAARGEHFRACVETRLAK